MTPIYFPFTWADARSIQALIAVFNRIAVYRPSVSNPISWMQPFLESGRLELRTPVREESDKLHQLAAEYRNWAQLHQGNDLLSMKTVQSSSAFLENFSSNIQSEILHYSESTQAPAADRVFNARLFLEIAETYDAQQVELNRDISTIRTMEKKFMDALGDHEDWEEPVPLGNLSLIQDDPGNFMLTERLQAWSILCLQGMTACTENNLLVTFRSSVIDWLRNDFPMEPVLSISRMPLNLTQDDNTRLWQENVLSYLKKLSESPWPGTVQSFEPPGSDYTWEDSLSINGFIIPGLSLTSMLQKLASGPISCAEPIVSDSNPPHTLVVAVDI
jgi:hypothetical protein